MKTIIEYIPLIYSRMEEHAAEKVALRRRLKTDAALVTAHCLLGLWLFWDMGFAPWHWIFWLCFAPLFVAVDVAARVFGSVRTDEDCEVES